MFTLAQPSCSDSWYSDSIPSPNSDCTPASNLYSDGQFNISKSRLQVLSSQRKGIGFEHGDQSCKRKSFDLEAIIDLTRQGTTSAEQNDTKPRFDVLAKKPLQEEIEEVLKMYAEE